MLYRIMTQVPYHYGKFFFSQWMFFRKVALFLLKGNSKSVAPPGCGYLLHPGVADFSIRV